MLYSFLSLYAKLTRYFIAEYHSGQESALVIPGIVRAFVLGNLRSEPDKMGQIFFFTWNMVVEWSRESSIVRNRVHVMRLVQLRKRHALPEKFTDEQFGDICSLSTQMVNFGYSQDARFILDIAREEMGSSAADIFVCSRLNLAHARVLDGECISDRRQALAQRREAIEILSKELPNADDHSRIPITEHISSGLIHLVENLLEFEGIDAAKDALARSFTLLKSLGDEKTRPGDHATYYYQLAILATYCGNLDESLQYLQNASRIASTAGLITYDYDLYNAIILIRREQYKEASIFLTKLYQEYLAHLGDWNDHVIRSHLLIGVALLLREKPKDAMYVAADDQQNFGRQLC
jgi:hypothetical protein